jgi:hypothetical protein
MPAASPLALISDQSVSRHWKHKRRRSIIAAASPIKCVPRP